MACRDDEIRRGPLLVRYQADDWADTRPIDPCPDGRWSPDLVLDGGPDDGGAAMVEAEHTIQVRVTNASDQPIAGVSVEAWVCDPSAGPAPAGQLSSLGRVTGFFAGALEPGLGTLVECEPKWTPTEADAPHGPRRLYLAANVWAESLREGEPIGGDNLKPCCDTHHALRDVRLRRPVTGRITTVAGTQAGFGGDDGPAVAAKIGANAGLAALPDGGFLIGDRRNTRVRLVSPDGIIRTVARADWGFCPTREKPPRSR